MAITYRQANAVAVGTVPTSTQWNQLANAINDRLTQGVGDPTWRIWWRVYSFFRKITNNDGDAVSANDEFFKSFGLLDPRIHPGVTWGDPIGADAGANVANPLMMFLFGLAAATPDFFDEGGRLADVTSHLALATDGSATLWSKGKQQRGAIDLGTGDEAAPARAAADSYKRVLDHAAGPFLESYGGYFSTPTTAYKFTAVRTGLSDLTFAVASVSSLVYQDDYYLLTLTDTTVVHLLHSDYIEGPYDGAPALAFSPGDQLLHALGQFAAEFRGSDASRDSDRYSVRSAAADFQSFFTRQYLLAPARGTTDGDTVDAEYPTLTLDATSVALPINSASNTFQFATGFVFAGYYAVATGLTQMVTVTLANADDHSVVYGTFNLTPGTSDTMKWFDAPAVAPNVVALLSDVELEHGAKVTIECAELLAHKPGLADAYFVLRASSSKGDDVGDLDTTGHESTSAPTIVRKFLTRGCITNDLGAVPDQAAKGPVQNPVYEAARAMFIERLRLIPRQQLSSYSVTGSASVFEFTRHTSVSGVSLDMWAGIAPPKEEIASGKIGNGIRYKVVGGTSVEYNGISHAAGTQFTGVEEATTYTKTAGTEKVKQVDGIITVAPQHSLTNEWTMFLSSAPFNTTDLPIDAYNDALAMLFNRAHFASDELSGGLFSHIQPGSLPNPSAMLNPEAPSGWNYPSGVNWLSSATDATRSAYFRSNRIYRPDYQILSVTSSDDDTTVTVTLDRQLDNIPEPDPAGGVYAQRTDENAVLDYLDYATGGGVDGNCRRRLGDQAGGGNDSFVGGCCVPRFYLTKLIPRAREDTPENDTPEPEDTRMLAHEARWAEFVESSICEGFLDPAALEAGACSRPPNLKWAELCRQAFSEPFIGLMPITVRDDNPKGYGPFPNTNLYADQFNRLAGAVNKLYAFLVEIPLDMESRVVKTVGRSTLSGSVSAGIFTDPGPTCDGGSAGTNRKLTSVDNPPVLAAASTYPYSGVATFAGDWGDGIVNFRGFKECSGVKSPLPEDVFYGDIYSGIETGTKIVVGSTIAGQIQECDGSNWLFRLLATEGYAELRFKAALSAFQAVPPDVLTMLGDSGVISVNLSYNEEWHEADAAGASPDCFTASPGPPLDAKFINPSQSDATCVQMALSSDVVAGADVLTLHARDLRPSYVWTFKCHDNMIGDGPSSSVEATALNYMRAAVPLVAQ